MDGGKPMSHATIDSTRTRRCPKNGIAYPTVPTRTILHHLRQPWNSVLTNQRYYYCDDPDCEIIYFGEDDEMIPFERLRSPIGVKDKGDESLICFCFDVSNAAAALESKAHTFVLKQTKEKNCDCEVRNPFGRCCLKDFHN
jgi:hypothetical protein